MHHEASGFVEHNEIFIFKQDIQRDLLRLGLSAFGFRPVYGHSFTGTRMVGRFGFLIIDKNLTFLNETLDCSARDCRELRT